jgi:DNA adenine methylase
VLIEKDANVASVWKVILDGDAEWLAKRIENFNLTKANVLSALSLSNGNRRERAFATILRNRVQRGGIMAAGAGLIKTGENGKGLHSRWYPQTLAKRIRAIAEIRERISFSNSDGFQAIESHSQEKESAFFVDPPYTVSARRLYSHWDVDHQRLFRLLKGIKGSVLLTYDKTQEISELASEFGFETKAVTMKNTHHSKMSELLVGRDLRWLRDAQAFAESTSQTAQVELAFPQ